MNFRLTGAEGTCFGIVKFVCNGYYSGISVSLLPYFLYRFKLINTII